MSNQINHTALLLFTRSSQEESVAKTFLPNNKFGQNKKLVRKIIDRSIHHASRSGMPFFVWDENLQHGNSFGERLANAVDAIFQKGFQKVLVIGNDCISLTGNHIREAGIALQTRHTVIAPTYKGGIYLIGLTQKIFDKNKFIAIRWQSSFAFQDLLKLASHHSVYQLPLRNDINNFIDLQTQVRFLSKQDPFRRFTESLLMVAPIQSFRSKYFISSLKPSYSFGITAPPYLLF